MGTNSVSRASDAPPALVTLDEALRPYPAVSVRSGREWIKRGRLPAVKVGKQYLVAPGDVAALLRPTLRQAALRPVRESEKARIARQLADAGIA